MMYRKFEFGYTNNNDKSKSDIHLLSEKQTPYSGKTSTEDEHENHPMKLHEQNNFLHQKTKFAQIKKGSQRSERDKRMVREELTSTLDLLTKINEQSNFHQKKINSLRDKSERIKKR